MTGIRVPRRRRCGRCRGWRGGAGAAFLLAATLLPAARPGSAQAIAPPELVAAHLGARCQAVPIPGGVWADIREALDRAGDPTAEPALMAAQDSLEAVLEADPGDLGARYALATLLGARSELNSGRSKLEWAGVMREEAERILEADPGHSGARHLLGRLHAGIMRMSGIKRFLARTLFGGEVMEGASWEVARRHLEAAAEGAPCLPHHHFELARLYEDTGRHGDAVREAGHVLQLQDLHPQYQETGRKASALLERLAPEPTGGAGSQGG